MHNKSVVDYKLPESMWKLMFYGSAWLYAYYLLIASGKYDYFQKTLLIWKGEYLRGGGVVCCGGLVGEFWWWSSGLWENGESLRGGG